MWSRNEQDVDEDCMRFATDGNPLAASRLLSGKLLVRSFYLSATYVLQHDDQYDIDDVQWGEVSNKITFIEVLQPYGRINTMYI